MLKKLNMDWETYKEKCEFELILPKEKLKLHVNNCSV